VAPFQKYLEAQGKLAVIVVLLGAVFIFHIFKFRKPTESIFFAVPANDRILKVRGFAGKGIAIMSWI